MELCVMLSPFSSYFSHILSSALPSQIPYVSTTPYLTGVTGENQKSAAQDSKHSQKVVPPQCMSNMSLLCQ